MHSGGGVLITCIVGEESCSHAHWGRSLDHMHIGGGVLITCTVGEEF